MTDQRELLELAAKAAGYALRSNKTPMGFDAFYVDGDLWNPRDDDGDCFRLETKLKFDVSWWLDCADIRSQDMKYEVTEYFSYHNGDKNAARRMASTRLAAEIGRAMG